LKIQKLKPLSKKLTTCLIIFLSIYQPIFADTNTGGDVNIRVVEGDLNLRSTIIEGKDINLDAAKNLNLTAAQNRQDISGKTSGSGWSIGASFVGSAVDIFGSFSKSRGSERGTTITNSGTLINAQGTVNIATGNDANIFGSKVIGGKVFADIGGDLNLASLQDSDVYKSKNQGIGISFGQYTTDNKNTAAAVQGSYNQGKTNSNYQSVTDQAGIYAGDKGVDIYVSGNTGLTGAVIASDAAKEKNKLSTDTLTFDDIKNKAAYSSGSVGVNFGSGNVENKDKGLTPDIGVKANGDANSTTQAAIADGTVEIRSKQNQDLSGLSRDTANALNELGKIFDKQKVEEQQELAALFGEEAFKIVGELTAKKQVEGAVAGKLADKYEKEAATARENGDFAKAAELESRAQQYTNAQKDLAVWNEGGAYKIALHAVIGGLMAEFGGSNFASGAAGAGLNEALQGELSKIKDTDARQWASAIVGATASNVVAGDSQSGASTAASGTANNSLWSMSVGFAEGIADGFLADVNDIGQLLSDPVAQIKEIATSVSEIVKNPDSLVELVDMLGDEAKEKYAVIMKNPDIDERDKQLGSLVGSGLYFIASTGAVPEKLTAKFPGLASKLNKVADGVKAGKIEATYITNSGRKFTNGMKMTSNEALIAAEEFLGSGYKDLGNGRYLSADGTKQVRMGDTDILGQHSGGAHMNFEILSPNPDKPGKMMVSQNIHIYLND
jgi:hypothetical protein